MYKPRSLQTLDDSNLVSINDFSSSLKELIEKLISFLAAHLTKFQPSSSESDMQALDIFVLSANIRK